MGRFTKLVISIVTLSVATAAFAGIAGAGSTLSKKAYLKEGNAICRTANDDLGAVFEEVFADFEEDQVPTEEQMQQAADGAIPIFRQALDDVEALEGPSSLDKKVDKVLDEYRAVVDDIEADPSIAFDAEGDDPFKKVDQKAKKVGLKACTQD